MKVTLLIALIFTSLGIAAQELPPQWCVLENTDGNIDAFTPKVMVDSFHNILLLGSIYSPGPALGFTTIKYDSSGNKLWERQHQTIATDLMTAAATDREGSVYVSGTTIQNPMGGPSVQVVFKYSPNGDILWQYYLKVDNGIATGTSTLLLDDMQNLLIFGQYFDTTQNKGGLFVQKKAPDGTLLWTSRHLENDYHYGSLQATRVGGRWVFWGRKGTTTAAENRILCWQLDSAGQTMAVALSDFDPEYGLPLQVDDEGSIYLNTGYYKVVKYSTDAEKQWSYSKSIPVFPPFIEPAKIFALTTDVNLNTYTTGYIRIDSFHVDALITKINPNGVVLWENHLSTPLSMNNIAANKFAWLNDSLLVATGTVRPNPDSNYYEPFLIFYTPEGFLKSAISNLPGRRNQINDIVPDGSSFYSTGIYTPEQILDDTRQFLCKYNLHDFLSSTRPERDAYFLGKMEILPNPNGGNCRLVLNHTGTSGPAILSAYAPGGNQVLEQTVSLTYGQQEIAITEMEQLPPGIYYMILRTSNQTYRSRAAVCR